MARLLRRNSHHSLWLMTLTLVASLVASPVVVAQEADTSPPEIQLGSAAAGNGQNPNVRTETVTIELQAPTSDQQPAAIPATEIPTDQLAEIDSDGDAIPDAFDNCPWTSNAGQEDQDGNGIGNSCEGQPREVTPEPDYDGDGIPDSSDNCWKMANPNQQDGDGDGLGNGCDEGSAPYIIGDPNDFTTEREIEDAVVVAAGEDITDGVAQGPPPLVEPTDAPDQQITGSADPGTTSGGAGGDRQRRNDGAGDSPPPRDTGDQTVDGTEQQTPVERGDRPRRNPNLTEPSGPVEPPPNPSRRMNQETVTHESLVRIDAGLETIVAATAGPVATSNPQTYSDMPTATPLSDPGDGPVPTASPQAAAGADVPGAPVPVEEGTILDVGSRRRADRAAEPRRDAVTGTRPAASATPGAGGVSTEPTSGRVIESADPGDGEPASGSRPTATPAGSTSGGSDGEDTNRRDRSSATAESEDAPWSADSDFRGGAVVITNEPIAGTEKDALFQTQRAGDGLARGETFVYAIPVPEDAIYRVRLYFAEVEYGVGDSPKKSKGKRVFNVDAEGERALQDLDIAAEVGPATALVKMFDIEVDDGTLELEFIAEKGQPTIAAIEVLIPRSEEQRPPSRKNDRGAVPPGEPRERIRRARLRRQSSTFGTI